MMFFEKVIDFKLRKNKMWIRCESMLSLSMIILESNLVGLDEFKFSRSRDKVLPPYKGYELVWYTYKQIAEELLQRQVMCFPERRVVFEAGKN